MEKRVCSKKGGSGKRQGRISRENGISRGLEVRMKVVRVKDEKKK